MSHKKMLQNRKNTNRPRLLVTGVTALMVVASRGWAALVEVGLQVEVDLRVRVVNGGTALDFSRYRQGVIKAPLHRVKTIKTF